MKRPELHKKYKHGDTRKDGYRFSQYRFRSGKWAEVWLSPKAFEQKVEKCRDYQRRKYEENPSKINGRKRVSAIKRKKRDPITHASRMLYFSALQRAKKSGLPFDLTREWVRERVGRGVCEVSGLPFYFNKIWNTEGGMRLSSPFIPSLDQIKPGRGYTQKNVRVVCYIYNTAKSVFRHEDVLTLAKALLSRIS